MGRVTYGIRFLKTNPLSNEIEIHKQKFQRLMLNHSFREAVTVGLDLADLQLAQQDNVDNNSSNESQEVETNNYATEALDTCEIIVVYLKENECYHLLARAYLIMVKCYQSLDRPEDAIETNSKLLRLLIGDDPLLVDDNMFRQASKLMGDIYYSNTALGDSISTRSTFAEAYSFYLIERKLIRKQLRSAENQDEQRDFDVMLQEVEFKLGSISLKLPDCVGVRKAEKHLKRAIHIAIELKDIHNERISWWQLGNLYRRYEMWPKVFRCQTKELDLLKKHEMDNDIIICKGAIARTHVAANDIPKCIQLCDEMSDWASNQYLHDEDKMDLAQHIARETKAMALTVQIELATLEQLLETAREQCNNHLHLEHPINQDGSHLKFIEIPLRREIAQSCLRISERLREWGIPLFAIRLTGLGLTYATSYGNDSTNSNVIDLMYIRIKLLQLKSSIHWEEHNTTVEYLSAIVQEIVSLAPKYISPVKEQLETIITAQILGRDLYRYYNDREPYSNWCRELQNTKRKYMEVTGQPFVDDKTAEYNDQYNCDGSTEIENSEKDSEEDSEEEENEIPIDIPPKFNITVRMSLNGENKELTVYYDDEMTTFKHLSESVTSMAWRIHGLDPVISHFEYKNVKYSSTEIVNKVNPGPGDILYAIILCLRTRSLEETYENACIRCRKPINPKVRDALSGKTLTTRTLRLRGAHLRSDDIECIIDMIHLVPLSVKKMDLSANLLTDSDVTRLLDAIPCPVVLNLRSNFLTFSSFFYLMTRHLPVLQKLDISYNNFEISTQKDLESLEPLYSTLRSLNMVGCYMLPDEWEDQEMTVTRDSLLPRSEDELVPDTPPPSDYSDDSDTAT